MNAHRTEPGSAGHGGRAVFAQQKEHGRNAVARAGFRQHIVFALIALPITIALVYSDILKPLDTWLYDVSLHARIAGGSAEPDPRVTVVTIDESSLSEFGRWPWSRGLHAEAIRRLTRAGAKGIAYDVVFAEAQRSDPDGDAELAAAIAQNGTVVLPVTAERPRPGASMIEVSPLPMFSDSAQALGHVDISQDYDGFTRGVFLRAGLGEAHWSTLALALLEGAQQTPRDELPGVALPVTGPISPQFWVRDRYILLPYSGPAQTFGYISFSDLINGRVPDRLLRDRWVLVGMTAAGYGGIAVTPLNRGQDRKPGVEFNAHVLKTLLDGSAIVPVSRPVQYLIACLFVFLPMLFTGLARRRSALAATGITIVLLLITSTVCLFWSRLWIAPAAPLAVLAAYLLILSYRPVQHWRQMANVDALTGLANRYCFNRIFDREWASAKRTRRPIALLLIDVDRFKQFNDRYGHQLGDQALRDIAKKIAKSARRPRDLATRVGGEEFALLLPETDRMNARQVAERVRQDILELNIPHTDMPSQRLSVSIGIHACAPDRDSSMNQLYDDADKALYQAKKQGRNAIMLYAHEM